MKKTLLLFITISGLTSCDNTAKKIVLKSQSASTILKPLKNPMLTNNTHTSADTPPVKPSVETIQVNSSDKIYFDNFFVLVLHPGESFITRRLDWNSNPDAKMFKTRITEAYKIGEINFAVHFITTIFGFGASCIMGFMIDVETGKIYDLPLGEENSCLFAEDRAIYRENSNLFISAICRENPEKEDYYTAFFWDESSKDKNEWKFLPVKSDEFLTKQQCNYTKPQCYIRTDEEEK